MAGRPTSKLCPKCKNDNLVDMGGIGQGPVYYCKTCGYEMDTNLPRGKMAPPN
jgi:transposase-like protein